MKIPIGARLPHDFADISTDDLEIVNRNRPLYRVTHVLYESPWSCLYRGKKIFRNFEFAKGTLTEAADDECLDVLIRTLSYPQTDDRDYIKERREHSWFEAKQVLGCRRTNLIAEPLDYLEIRNDHDKFAFSRPGKIPTTEPVLIFETIHGDNLARWRQSVQVDIATGLNVLGQVLEFWATLHDAKLLVNVVSPAIFWVDKLHRVHFLGTENVIDEKRAARWRRLFPNERYSQGFVAPELLQPDAVPSRQSDLYGWATLVWFLLTGDSPAKLASNQQQRWAEFKAEHRARLRRELSRLITHQVVEVKGQLNVEGVRFEALWPDSFLDGLWACLDPDVLQRPSSVADLRAWWGNPPPPPVPSCLSVLQSNDRIRFAFSTDGLPSELKFQILCKFDREPRSFDDGEVVWQGPATERVEFRIPPLPAAHAATAIRGDRCYSIFAGFARERGTTLSRPTVATILDGTVSAFRRSFAESLTTVSGTLPDEIALLVKLDSAVVVAEELLESQKVLVRNWAVRLLERDLVANSTNLACRRLLEGRGLVDSEIEIRRQAAGALIRTYARVDVNTIVDLAQRMGGNAVDEMIRMAREFRAFGVASALIEEAIESLEQQHRIVTCPECQMELRIRELDQHLTNEHRYVPLDGKLLPFGRALKRLWSRILQSYDTPALDSIVHFLQDHNPQNVKATFAAAFASQVLSVLQSSPALESHEQAEAWINNVAKCLRSNNIALSACALLLPHDDSRIRQLAREVVVSAYAQTLVDDHITTAVFRHAVNRLAPAPIVGERIEACRRLIEFGANPLVGELCARDLDLENLVDCPECGTAFTKRDLTRHLQLDHQIFEWDGQRFDRNGLVRFLIVRTVAVEPDAFAAERLTELFVEQYGNRASEVLHSALRKRFLECATHNDVDALAVGLGASVGNLQLASSLSQAFMNEENNTCRTVGLAIYTSLDCGPTADLSRKAAALLGQPEISTDICQQVAIHFLRRPNMDPDVCRRALLGLASHAADKLLGIDQLKSLEQWVGPSSIIETVCKELALRVRMRCPRCDVVLNQVELAEHVRSVHKLVLQGRSVRQPWSMVAECLDQFAENADIDLLKRAEQFADLASPKKGRQRLWREALRRGIALEHYRQALIKSVRNTTDSLCPQCWENIPDNDAPPCRVEVDEQGNIQSEFAAIKGTSLPGIWGSVEITPWQGPAPQWALLRPGAIAVTGLFLFLVGAVIGITILRGTPATEASLLGGSVTSFVGMLAVATWYWPRSHQPLSVAWELVVPNILDSHQDQRPLPLSHSAFLAGLARATRGHANAKYRQPSLERSIEILSQAVREKSLPSQHLNELWRLRFEDSMHAKRRHGTRVVVLKELLSQALAGTVSLDFVTCEGVSISVLHRDEPIGTVWHAMKKSAEVTQRTRLHRDELIEAVWHVVVEAREKGLVAADLIEIFRQSSALTRLAKEAAIEAQTLPFLFAVLEMETTNRMPRGIVSVSQLISAKKYSSFSDYETLLARSEPAKSWRDQDAIFLCPTALIFRDQRFTLRPDVSVNEKKEFVQTGWTHQRLDGGPDMRYSHNPPKGYFKTVGYNLNVGRQSWDLASEPTELAERIESAAGYFFQGVKPLAIRISQEENSPNLWQFLESPANFCPNCKCELELQKGNVAVQVRENQRRAGWNAVGNHAEHSTSNSDTMNFEEFN